MTKYQLTPNNGALVAIDVAKARNEVLIDIPGSGRHRRLTVLNERPDHDRLVELLRAFTVPIVCGFEATGNYHRPLAWRLLEAGFEVRLISSVALARTREALHNSWDKMIQRTLRLFCICSGSALANVITIHWRTASVISKNCQRPTKPSQKPKRRFSIGF